MFKKIMNRVSSANVDVWGYATLGAHTAVK